MCLLLVEDTCRIPPVRSHKKSGWGGRVVNIPNPNIPLLLGSDLENLPCTIHEDNTRNLVYTYFSKDSLIFIIIELDMKIQAVLV